MPDFFAHIVEDDSLDASQEMRGRLMKAADVLRFANAGKATFTLVSTKTQARFTYRLTANDDSTCLFVALLNGPDNEADYRYLGRISRGVFWLGRKVPREGDISRDAPSAKAFDWTWRQLAKGQLPDAVEIWHEGRCGRCNRKLTVPASIASGFGPECIGKV
jgi:hypothetical protein